MPERATKEKNLTLYTAFGGVAIQNRIATSFFLWRRFWLTQSFSCKKARSPPLRFDFKNSDRRKRKVTFHKAKEEYKWKQWKEQEEKILRESGVSEEVIQRIRELDWQDFNAERRFWEHFSSNQEELYTQKMEEEPSVILNIQQLLDSIENEQLLQILMETDKKTLQILLLKMWGFSVREIAGQMGLPEKTIYTRMERLKKKIKKVLRK